MGVQLPLEDNSKINGYHVSQTNNPHPNKKTSERRKGENAIVEEQANGLRRLVSWQVFGMKLSENHIHSEFGKRCRCMEAKLEDIFIL